MLEPYREFRTLKGGAKEPSAEEDKMGDTADTQQDPK